MIFLVGYMGSGKTKIGKAIASAKRFAFYDTDEMIAEQTGKTISKIFEKNGEEAFRKLEKKILRQTKDYTRCVIATGGGLPCYNNNMDWMNENGITIYLDASPGLLFHRLVKNRKGRPLIENLTDIELMETITRHLALRSPFYLQSQIVVNALSADAKKISAKIEKLK